MEMTDRLKKILTMAETEAVLNGHRYTASEHVLVAILKEDSNMASSALKNSGIDTKELLPKVRSFVKKVTSGK